MREQERYVINAFRNGLLTAAQASALKRHAAHHSRQHMFVMLHLVITDKKPLPFARDEAMRLVGK